MRMLARLAPVLAVGWAVLLTFAAPANAHPFLLFTTPALDSAVAESPPSIVLVFNEGVTVEPRAISITDLEGNRHPVGESRTGKGGTVVSAELPEKLRPGTYLVHWAAVGVDGHFVGDEFRFAVGAEVTAAAGAGEGEPIADWFAALRKWLMLIGFALAFGGIVAERFMATARTENRALPLVRPWSKYAATLGFAAAAASAAVLVADLGTPAVLWESQAGLAITVEAAAFAAALGLLMLRRPMWALAPLAGVAIAEGVVSHGGVESPVVGAALTAVHVGAAGLWAGALVHTSRAVLAWRSWPHAARWMVVSYARMALWVFLVVAGAGLVLALILVPLPALTTTAYGRTLLVKLALVAVAVGLAVVGRRALRVVRLHRLRQTTRVEAVTLLAVIAVTAVLVSMPSPGAADTGAAAPPPPPRGVAVPGGGRAGEIGVNVVASEEQVVVRLFAPRRTDYIGPPEDQNYELSGRLAIGGVTEDVRFRPCGGGCFVAPTRWRDGDNVLTLRAAAERWTGGTVAIAVPWPAVPPGELIQRTLRVMNRVDDVTIYESATSDTSAGFPEPMVLDTDGPQLLSNEPYNSGVAPVAVVVRRESEPTRLLLGFPAAGAFAELALDGLGRISSETLVGPKVSIQRRLVYPDQK